MKFDELPLCRAVRNVFLAMQRENEKPRGDQWIRDDRNKDKLLRLIQGALPVDNPYISSNMLDAWSTYGKAPNLSGTNQKKLDLVVQVFEAHKQAGCFWAGRVKDPCDEEVDLDRLVPESRGGRYVVENCVLACSHHNRQRSDQSVEDYLQSYQEKT